MLPGGTPASFFGALEFGRERVSIRAGQAAHNARAKPVASMASGILPGPFIGPWPFDGKEPLIVVGDNEEELDRWLNGGHGCEELHGTSA